MDKTTDREMFRMARQVIWRDYYEIHLTLDELMEKWRVRYSEQEILGAIDWYDLDKEPKAHPFNAHLQRAWERECRRLNPKAWEGR